MTDKKLTAERIKYIKSIVGSLVQPEVTSENWEEMVAGYNYIMADLIDYFGEVFAHISALEAEAKEAQNEYIEVVHNAVADRDVALAKLKQATELLGEAEAAVWYEIDVCRWAKQEDMSKEWKALRERILAFLKEQKDPYDATKDDDSPNEWTGAIYS